MTRLSNGSKVLSRSYSLVCLGILAIQRMFGENVTCGEVVPNLFYILTGKLLAAKFHRIISLCCFSVVGFSTHTFTVTHLNGTLSLETLLDSSTDKYKEVLEEIRGISQLI